MKFLENLKVVVFQEWMNEYHYQSHYCIVAMKLILILVYFSNIFVHINAGDVRHLNGLKHWDNGLILTTEQHEREISGMYTMKRIEGDIRGFYEGLLRMIEQKAGTADFTEGNELNFSSTLVKILCTF